MDERIDRDRLSVVTGGLLLALALARLLDGPSRPFQVTVFGSPLGFDLSETAVLLLTIGGMAAAGVESLVRAHPQVRQGQVRRTALFWIVPVLLSVSLASWLSRIMDIGLWTLGLLAAAVILPLALAAEYTAVSPDLRRDARLQWSHNVLIHLVALILFAALYDARLRALSGAPLLFLSATLLASRLFWSLTGRTRSAAIYGMVVAVPLAELLAVLNYVPLSDLQGGLILFLGFYVLVGLLQHHLRDERVKRQHVLEYLAVAFAAIIIILLASP